MADRFETVALPRIKIAEGGYVNDPDDAGGPTNYGITWRTLARHRGVPASSITPNMVKTMKWEEAVAIYRAGYWNTVRGDDLPPGLDYMVFQGGVHGGPRTSVRFMQRAIGGIAADGAFGPKTLAAVGRLSPSRQRQVISRLAQIWRDYYIELIERRPANEKYRDGWMRRIDKAEEFCLSEVVATRPAPVQVVVDRPKTSAGVGAGAVIAPVVADAVMRGCDSWLISFFFQSFCGG